MAVFSSLTRLQKEAIALLQMGTFLEYMDLMLYVHMAVLLNDLFFPKSDPHTAALLAAFAFCSTYVLRPVGALIFGTIGDHVGRKPTVIITTAMMSLSCIMMANLPTYAEIGIKAAYVVTICRIIQGMSSMGEMMGAEVYVSELVKPPAQYVAVSCVGLSAIVGGMVALGIAALVTKIEMNWRIAFWAGAGIAVIGSAARYRLRETPDFLTTKISLQKKIEDRKEKLSITAKRSIRSSLNQMSGKRQAWTAYFLVYCGWPLSFYLAYMYFNPLLKNKFGYSPEDIILHNFFLSVLMCISVVFWIMLSYRIHPLIILRERCKILFGLTLLLPFCINSVSSSFHVFLIQASILIFSMVAEPAPSIFIMHFPVLRRFTTASFVYALSRALMFIVTSFSLVYLTEWLGYYGLWVVMFPIISGFFWGVRYFEKLEADKLYPQNQSLWSAVFRKKPQSLA